MVYTNDKNVRVHNAIKEAKKDGASELIIAFRSVKLGGPFEKGRNNYTIQQVINKATSKYRAFFLTCSDPV